MRKLLRAPGTPVQDVPDRGLDHGAYVPLVEMYPEADIPVLQVSMPTLDPVKLMEIGRRLAPLRDEGVLIVGSGFFTHNLAALRQGGIPAWSAEFDAWGREALQAQDVDALLDFTRKSPAGRLAHPRTQHFAPLFSAHGRAIPTASTRGGQGTRRVNPAVPEPRGLGPARPRRRPDAPPPPRRGTYAAGSGPCPRASGPAFALCRARCFVPRS
ncbi:hypothetical protein SALBM217S_00766 [Streptomyces griseoloalbus]